MFARVFDGSVKTGDRLRFSAAGRGFAALEVGMFAPEERPVPELSAGEIGYIVTGLKEAGVASVGDTLLTAERGGEPLPGYYAPSPVVWASLFPERKDDFTLLGTALSRLRLSDSALSYEEESSGALGHGFRCGFLGMLHLEIVTERLRREHGLAFIVTVPSIAYEITHGDGMVEEVYAPSRFPEHGAAALVRERSARLSLIVPPERLGAVLTLLYEHEGEVDGTESFAGGRTLLTVLMPLRELMRGFFDALKSATSGYASLSYEISEMRPAEVERLDVLVAGELVPAFSRVVGTRRVEIEARLAVERLVEALPRQLFTTKIQARARGRIIASRTLSALRKDVTGYLYGGDITRKMKLREKQKKGKKRLQATGKVVIPPEVFLKMVKSE